MFPRCVGDPGVSDWFDESYDPDISPVWTRDNIQLPSDVYYWWVVSNNMVKLHARGVTQLVCIKCGDK